MATVYTDLLARVHLSTPGDTVVPGPAVGFRWVLTDIEAFNLIALQSQGLRGFSITDDDGFYIFAVLSGQAVGSTMFQWRGRQVLDHPGSLLVSDLDAFWWIRITGYQLTLP